jgi:hypothetical protein
MSASNSIRCSADWARRTCLKVLTVPYAPESTTEKPEREGCAECADSECELDSLASGS